MRFHFLPLSSPSLIIPQISVDCRVALQPLSSSRISDCQSVFPRIRPVSQPASQPQAGGVASTGRRISDSPSPPLPSLFYFSHDGSTEFRYHSSSFFPLLPSSHPTERPTKGCLCILHVLRLTRCSAGHAAEQQRDRRRRQPSVLEFKARAKKPSPWQLLSIYPLQAEALASSYSEYQFCALRTFMSGGTNLSDYKY